MNFIIQPVVRQDALQQDPPGYIQPHALDELWFHTGTACNLSCPFCLEGSRPGDNRLERITLQDAQPFIDEALHLGVKQFSFTGGEPFIVKDFVNILHYAAAKRPCLVLTNGTDPVLKRLKQIATLRDCKHPVSLRISIDYPDRDRHDAGRGSGSFDMSWQSLRALHELGFRVSIARQMDRDEAAQEVEARYRDLLVAHDLPADTTLVAFPDFLTPGASPDVPLVTENCMTTYQTAESRRQFMCAFSKMVIRRNGRMRVYACTLVDDDSRYDLGGTLTESMSERILMRHHRCYACFAYGSSCSEINR
jgi:sulfatase maturation enzyme AslB (radical SAM superfamily)